MIWRTSIGVPPSSRIVPTGSSALATATSSSGLSRIALSPSGYVAITSPCYGDLLGDAPLYTARPDLEDRRWLGIELDRRVVDPEARVEHRVQRVEDPVVLAHVADDHVRAHRLAPRRQRPHVQVVHAPHAGHARHRLLDGGEIEVRGDAFEQHVHRLPQEPPRPRHDE